MNDICFYSTYGSLEIVPGIMGRDWMENFPSKNPYRCLPLNTANRFGWDFLLPCDIEITWNGGAAKEDIQIEIEDLGYTLVDSNFTKGIVTFNLGYVIRTPDNWQVLVTGTPNLIYDNFYPFMGIVETDWFSYPFTMNWQILKQGKISLKKNDPICRVIPIQINSVLELNSVTQPIKNNKLMAKQITAYSDNRKKQLSGDKDAKELMYFKGKCPMQDAPENRHFPKLQLKKPVKL